MDFKNMTADEIFALAEQKQADERKWFEQENKAKVAELREERKQLLLRHKKEINEVNAKIKALGGKVAGATTTGKGRTGVSAAVVELLDAGEMDTNTLRKNLDEMGVSVKNIGQTLAYLKKKGKVASVARGIYKKCD